MTQESRDEAVSASGGTMRRLTGPPSDAVPDLSLLEPLRWTPHDDDVRPAGEPPYFSEGDVITWHYGMWADALRVVRDDARGLVAWLPSLPAPNDSSPWPPTVGGYVTDLSTSDRTSSAVNTMGT